MFRSLFVRGKFWDQMFGVSFALRMTNQTSDQRVKERTAES